MDIGLGCVNLGSAGSGASAREHIRLVRTAIDGGVTVLDTANAYGAGASERVVGRAVRGRRDAVVISTKAGYVVRPRSAPEQCLRRVVATGLARVRPRPPTTHDHPASVRSSYQHQDFTPAHLRSSLDASLRRLGVDHVDVLQLHGPPERSDDILAQLDDLRSAGKVLRFGVGSESIAAALAWAGAPNVSVVQLPYGLLDPEAERDVFPVAAERGLDVWVRGVLGGGVLAAAIADPSSISGHEKAPLIRRLADVASEAGIALDELAVRWVIGQPTISTTLLGMSSPDHLRRNLALATSAPLPADVRAAIDAIATPRPPQS